MVIKQGVLDWFSRGTKCKAKKRNPRRFRSSQHFLEALEDRSMFAGDTYELRFEVPADVEALGVYASVNGKLINSYNSIPANTFVYYDTSVSDYVVATTSSDLSFELTVTNGYAKLEIPDTEIVSGQVVIGVGSAPIFGYNGSGISTPTPSTNPTNYFGLYEFTLDSGGLDIDFSEVDQVGVPFYVTTTNPTPPNPADQGFGITMPRGDLFNNYGSFIGAQAGAAGFQATVTEGNFNGTQYRIVAPKDLMLGNDKVQFPTVSTSFSKGGKLVVNQQYYYFVTATSASGESIASDGIGAMTATAGMQTCNITWEQYVGATGYKIYRGTTMNAADAKLVGKVTSGSTLSFADAGKAGTVAPPPNGYTFSSLNSYFNDAIKAFFDYYTAPNSFQIYIKGDNLLLQGQVTTESSGLTYLEVHPAGDPSETYRIYKPIFAENTNIPGAPSGASLGIPHLTQSPAEMIFACDGVFNPGAPGILADLGNEISSAFNRGLANNFSITPSNWASNPTFFDPAPLAGGSLDLDTTYYYVITAVTGYKGDVGTPPVSIDVDFGESVISMERAYKPTAGNQAVTLNWQAIDKPGVAGAYGIKSYNVYRSTTPGSGYKFLKSVPNDIPHHPNTPATSTTDDGSITPTDQAPPVFYAEGSTSNWYSAYWHLNSTNDTVSGVSINGLAYGYPYDDQGGFSTNIQIPSLPETVTIHLVSWGRNPNPPHPHPHPNPNPHPHPHPAPPTEPYSIKILSQPKVARIGDTSTVEFIALTEHGHPFLGGAEINIKIDGMEKGDYTVETDPTTGKGTLTFVNKKLGINMLKLSTEDDTAHVYSNVFQVVTKQTPKKVFEAINKADKAMSTKAMQKALKKLAKYYR